MVNLWKKEYEFGIEIIDEQHKKFVETLNKLSEAISKKETAESLTKIFKELDNYATEHFLTEEEYLEEFGCGGLEEQRVAHQEFRDKLSEFKSKLPGEKVQVVVEMIDYLEDWLLNHLNDLDRKYIACFKEHGLK